MKLRALSKWRLTPVRIWKDAPISVRIILLKAPRSGKPLGVTVDKLGYALVRSKGRGRP